MMKAAIQLNFGRYGLFRSRILRLFNSDKKDSRFVQGGIIGREPTKEELEKIKSESIINPKRTVSEGAFFTDEQKERRRKEVKSIVDKYIDREKYSIVVDEIYLDEVLTGLLSLKQPADMLTKEGFSSLLSKMIDKVWTIYNFELLYKLFALVVQNREFITSEQLYQMIAVWTNWAQKLNQKQIFNVLSMIPEKEITEYKEIFESFENIVLKRVEGTPLIKLELSDQLELISLLGLYRKLGNHSEVFISVLQSKFIDEAASLGPAVLTRFLEYYLHLEDIDIESREVVLKKMDDLLVLQAGNLGAGECVGILSALVKGGAGSPLAKKLLLKNIQDNISDLSRSRLRIIVALLPLLKPQMPVEVQEAAAAVQTHISNKISKVEPLVLYEILISFSENSLATKDFLTKALKAAAYQIYLYDFSQVVRLFWLNNESIKHSVFYEKAVERFKEKDLTDDESSKLPLQDFAFLVWSLSNAPEDQREALSFVQPAFQIEVQAREQLSFREISQVFWAVTLRSKISELTWKKLEIFLYKCLSDIYGVQDYSSCRELSKLSFTEMNKQLKSNLENNPDRDLTSEMTTWEVMNLLWCLSKFATKATEPLIKLLAPVSCQFTEIFSATELLMLLRVFSEVDYFQEKEQLEAVKPSDETKELLTSLLDPLEDLVTKLSRDEQLILQYYLVNSPLLQFRDHTTVLKKLFEISRVNIETESSIALSNPSDEKNPSSSQKST